jgi:hypothetical protein
LASAYLEVVKNTILGRRARRAGSPVRGSGPLSVPLPPALRGRLAAQAEKRRLKLATAARVLLDERLSELEETTLLTQAEEWQRAQAWATWEKIAAGDTRDVPMDRFVAHDSAARARLAKKHPIR